MPGTADQQNAVLRRQRDRFVCFTFAVADVVLEIGADGFVHYAAGAVQEVFGEPAEALRGSSLLARADEADRPLLEVLLEGLNGGGRFGPVALALKGANGRAERVRLNGYRLPDRPDVLYMALERRRVPLAAAETSVSNGDQRLPGAAAFAEEAVARARTADHELQLTLLDVEGLDSLAERCGQRQAQNLLDRYDALLGTRAVGGLAGRFNDSKYGLVHKLGLDPAEVGRQMEAFAAHVDSDGPGISARAHSLGLDVRSLSPEEAAQALVYTINRFARTQAGAFTMEALARDTADLIGETARRIAACKATMESDAVELAFQPIVDLGTRRVQYHEALARIDGHSPYDFVTFAEDVGLSEAFDLTVCRRVLRALAGSGSLARHPVSINLSGRSVESPRFIEDLLKLLHDLPAQRPKLVFEVTESARIHDLSAVGRLLSRVREAGYPVGLDDFGAGFSSFPYLANLAVDFVKIDGSYVARLDDSPRDLAMLAGMVRLANDLGISTIAEQIETEDQVERLRQLGAQRGQGYLFGRPGPAPDLRGSRLLGLGKSRRPR